MPLQVIGAGFGRTGTASLKAALELLGFGPCYHMFEIRRSPWKAGDWLPAVRGEALDWEKVFRGYRSAVDWPTCNFYVALAQAYPDARFVLTTRDPGSWYDSVHRTLFAVWRSFPRWTAVLPLFRPVHQLLRGLIWDGVFEGQFDNRDFALTRFNAHEAAVMEYLPAERVLLFRVEEGWEPLCSFLGVEVPDAPFPRLNEARELERVVWWMRWGIRALYAACIVIAGHTIHHWVL